MTAPHVLIVDNFDSFTFTLADYLKSLGAATAIVRNDAISVEEALSPGNQGILLSPGPGSPQQAGISVALAAACIERQRPLLGVCLGHQAIAVACGFPVGRSVPVHGKTVQVEHDCSGVFAGIPSPFDATRYNSLSVFQVAPPLEANATTGDGAVMGLRHLAAPVHGVQFHPESIGSAHGHALLGNFLKLVQRPASAA